MLHAKRVWRAAAAILCTLSAVLGGVGVRPAVAQPGGQLTYGQSVEGRITDAAFRIIYTFQGEAGEIIEARLTRLDGNLDPTLILLDAQNTLIGRDEDSGGGTTAALTGISLPSRGVYFLIATRFGQSLGLTTGRYSLKLDRVGIAADPRLMAGGATALTYGQDVVLPLDNTVYQHLYTFAALRGDLITVTMRRISGDLDPTLTLADADGNVILINDEDSQSPGTLDAAINRYRVPRSGNYLLVASRFGGKAGTSRGAYALRLEKLTGEMLATAPDKAAFIEYGTVVQGAITKDGLRRYYTFRAAAGDVIRAEVVRVRGNLDPTLELYTADLKPLAFNDAGIRGRSARITAFRVAVDGLYILVVSRFNGESGLTEGEFSLTVTAGP